MKSSPLQENLQNFLSLQKNPSKPPPNQSHSQSDLQSQKSNPNFKDLLKAQISSLIRPELRLQKVEVFPNPDSKPTFVPEPNTKTSPKKKTEKDKIEEKKISLLERILKNSPEGVTKESEFKDKLLKVILRKIENNELENFQDFFEYFLKVLNGQEPLELGEKNEELQKWINEKNLNRISAVERKQGTETRQKNKPSSENKPKPRFRPIEKPLTDRFHIGIIGKSTQLTKNVKTEAIHQTKKNLLDQYTKIPEKSQKDSQKLLNTLPESLKSSNLPNDLLPKLIKSHLQTLADKNLLQSLQSKSSSTGPIKKTTQSSPAFKNLLSSKSPLATQQSFNSTRPKPWTPYENPSSSKNMRNKNFRENYSKSVERSENEPKIEIIGDSRPSSRNFSRAENIGYEIFSGKTSRLSEDIVSNRSFSQKVELNSNLIVGKPVKLAASYKQSRTKAKTNEKEKRFYEKHLKDLWFHLKTGQDSQVSQENSIKNPSLQDKSHTNSSFAKDYHTKKPKNSKNKNETSFLHSAEENRLSTETVFFNRNSTSTFLKIPFIPQSRALPHSRSESVLVSSRNSKRSSKKPNKTNFRHCKTSIIPAETEIQPLLIPAPSKFIDNFSALLISLLNLPHPNPKPSLVCAVAEFIKPKPKGPAPDPDIKTMLQDMFGGMEIKPERIEINWPSPNKSRKFEKRLSAFVFINEEVDEENRNRVIEKERFLSETKEMGMERFKVCVRNADFEPKVEEGQLVDWEKIERKRKFAIKISQLINKKVRRKRSTHERCKRMDEESKYQELKDYPNAQNR